METKTVRPVEESTAILSPFMGRSQAGCVAVCLAGEEGDFFVQKLSELADVIEAMPKSYEQDGKGDDAIAYLHYFGFGDWWITEKDAGSPDDTPEDAQSQAFGLCRLQFGPSLGYVSLPEILAAGVELDFYWTPKTLREIKAKL